MTDLLTVAEACDRLRVSRRTLYRLNRAGRIRFLHPTPGRVVIEAREVEAYIRWMRDAA